MNNYPLGTENDSSAPWNTSEKDEVITVTCSNTLSKDFEITLPGGENTTITEEFFNQQFSAKEALDLVARRADEAKKFIKLLHKKYPNISNKLLFITECIQSICKDWNEDELEIVKD